MQKVTNRQLLAAASLLILVTASFRFIIVALDNSLNFSGVAFNGSFQLLNPLLRIDEGQAVGRDFNFFHGAGVPYIHYPLFWLLGSDIFASEFAKWILSPLAFMVSAYIFLYAATRRHLVALVGTAATLNIALYFYGLDNSGLVFPSNSLLGIRSFVTLFVACTIMFRDRLTKPVFNRSKRLNKFTWFELLSGVTLALSFLMGTEYGIGAAVAYVAYTLISHYQNWKDKLVSLGFVGAVGLLTVIVTLALLSKGHPMEPLVYALKDVPGDQFWYFGTPPNKFLDSYQKVWQVISSDKYVIGPYALFLAALAATYFYKRMFGKTQAYYGFVFAILAGLMAQIAMLGYYQSAQTYHLARMSSLVLFAAGALLLPTFKNARLQVVTHNVRKKLDYHITRSRLLGVTMVLFMIFSLHGAWYHVNATQSSQDVKATLVRFKRKLQGDQHQVITADWEKDMNQLMPVIQKNNSYAIATYDQDGYKSGVNARSRSVALSQPKTVLKPGSVVYLAGSGRQTVQSVSSSGNMTFIKISAGSNKELEPKLNGSPNRLVVAKDFVSDPATLWSTYTGLADYEKGTLNPSKTGADFAMHALGPEKRAQYVEDFSNQRPDYVLTIRKTIFMFEEWLQDHNWPFYNQLVANYGVVKTTPTYVLWEKKKDAWDTQPKSTKWTDLKVKDKYIVFPSIRNDGPRAVGLVRVKYNFGGGDPKIYDKTTRWFLKPFGRELLTELPVSLSPYEREAVFPFVYLPTPEGPPKKDSNIIEVQTHNLLPLKTKVNIISAEMTWLQLDPITQRALSEEAGEPGA